MRTYPREMGNFDCASDFSSFKAESIQITEKMIEDHYQIFRNFLINSWIA